MTRVFLSHASEDKAFVDALYSHLSTQNVDCWFDKHEIFLGDNIPEKINEGLATSDFGVLVLSKNYLRENKYWTWEELFALLNKESVGEGRSLLPIRLDLDHAVLTKRVPLIAARLSVDFADRPKEAAEEILRAIGRVKAPPLRPITGIALPEIGLPSRHTVRDSKPKPMDCVGREVFLSDVITFFEIHANRDLAEVGVLSISGLPGAGKSTVALELAYRIGRSFSGGVYWINAGSSEKIVASLKEIISVHGGGSDLHASELARSQANVDEQFDITRRLFEAEPCFLIVDSLDSEFVVQASIQRLLPRTGASRILVTTRSERLDLPVFLTDKSLPDLSDADVEALLLQFNSTDDIKHSRVAAKSVGDKLGRLPLALQLAARNMRDSCIGIRDYDAKLSTTPDILGGLTTRSRFLPSLTKLLEDSYESLKKSGEVGAVAQKILSRCAIVAMVDELLYRWEKENGVDRDFPLGIAASMGFRSVRDESASLFNEAIELAEGRGLLRTRGRLGNDIWVHALTLEMLNKKIDEDDCRYLAFRFRGESNLCFRILESVIWVDIKAMMKAYAGVVGFVERKSLPAALEIIDTWLELEPFNGSYSTEKKDSSINGEELAKRAVFLINEKLSEKKWSKASLHFRILQAHSAFLCQKISIANEQFNAVWSSLKDEPQEIELVDLLDLGFHFGCLLIRLGGDEQLNRAREVWRITLKNMMSVAASLDRIEQIPYSLKLRLSRLFEAARETFPEILDATQDDLRIWLLVDLKSALEHRISLASQFHQARGPLVPALQVMVGFKDE